VAEFRINISKLSDGIHEYRFEAEPSKIGLDERFQSPVTVEVRLDKNLKQIFLQAEAKVRMTSLCDRCLDEFTTAMDQKYSMLYIQSDRSTIDVGKEEELQVLTPDMNYIDLDEDVRQYVELAVPWKMLCKEECKGICPLCGGNKNAKPCDCSEQIGDLRWEELKKLKKN